MSAQPVRMPTPAEYLAFERAAATRHEYYNGLIVAQAGASRQHNLIATNVVAFVHPRISRQSCETYSSDMRVRIPRTSMYVYPDVVIVCGRPEFEDDHGDILLNPIIVIEILSPATEQVDRGRKARAYRSIPSLREYVLIAQDRAFIERYVRQPDAHLWLLEDIQEPDGVLTLESVGVAISLADVYAQVVFEPEPEPDGLIAPPR